MDNDQTARLEEPGQASYDPSADALYVRLRDTEWAATIEVHDGYMVDVDAAGEPVGVELLGLAADAWRASAARRSGGSRPPG
jgi:uncharacterized protein YuzE